MGHISISLSLMTPTINDNIHDKAARFEMTIATDLIINP